MSDHPVVPAAPPEIQLLARPLEIVPVGTPGDARLGARLVSHADSGAVAAEVTGTAATFDPDEAFRVLDDQRTRAETVLQWVADSLAGVAPEPEAESSFRPWLPALAVSAGVIAAVLLIPAATTLVIGKWVFLALLVLLVLGGLSAAGATGCVMGGVVAAVLLVIAIAVSDQGWEVGFCRVVLGFLGTLISILFFGPPVDAGPGRDGPTEYVLHEGEAATHTPELCLVGEKKVLAVVIQCRAEDDRLLRQVVLPVHGATRRHAGTLARLAHAPDEVLAQRRIAEEAAGQTAAEALQRVAELERSRRSLPEG